MAKYIELKIPVSNNNQKDMLIALLSEVGADGFEEEKGVLKAFIKESCYNEIKSNEIIEQNNLNCSISTIEDRNWNAEWESNFNPVVIGNFCAIRAAFHAAVQFVVHDIIITPKMSFGTGHHATTHMMVKAMEMVNFFDKKVFDFGTGTGVLAILAEKMGAAEVTAIDNDPWSIENAYENFNANNCSKILLINGESLCEEQLYNIILANVNRNILLQNIPIVKQHLANEGVFLLSGLLTGDEEIIMEEARNQNLLLLQRLEMNGWLCLIMVNS